MPSLKLLIPFATSPIIEENRVPAEQQQEQDRYNQNMPDAETAHEELLWKRYLVSLVVAFQLKLKARLIEGVKKARGLEVVNPGVDHAVSPVRNE